MLNTSTPSPTLPGVIYVGRTEGEMTTVLGKVGLVENPTFLKDRVISYRVADRIFHFVLEAAFAVDLPPGETIESLEGWIHTNLEAEGLTRFGENFQAPEASMTFLARMVEAVIVRRGFPYTRLEIKDLRDRAQALNSKAWQKLRKKPKRKPGACVYQDWLIRHSDGYRGILHMIRPHDYVRDVLALGYLLGDLAAGSGLNRIEVPLRRGGTLNVYPCSLEAAAFQAKAERGFHLASTTSFSACPERLEDIPVSPFAMTVQLGDNLETIEVPNTFLSPTRERPDEVSFSPDYLAALGLLGGSYGESCLYEGLGVHAMVPLEMTSILREFPEDLAGVRFWLGILHCLEMGIRLQDFELPACLGALWSQISNAALIMIAAGHPVPEGIQNWVSHAWIPPVSPRIGSGSGLS